MPSTLVTRLLIVLIWTPPRPRFSSHPSPPDLDAIMLLLGHYPWTRILLWYSLTFLDDVAPSLMTRPYAVDPLISVTKYTALFPFYSFLSLSISDTASPRTPVYILINVFPHLSFLTFLLRTHKASTPVALPRRLLYP